MAVIHLSSMAIIIRDTPASGNQITSVFSISSQTSISILYGPCGMYSAASKQARIRLIVPTTRRAEAEKAPARLAPVHLVRPDIHVVHEYDEADAHHT